MNIFEAENLYFLGPKGTYAQAAWRKFKADFNIKISKETPLKPITKIIQTVDENPCDMAVLPIENYIEGIVRETIDNLVKIKDKNLKIVAETVIPINHCLISNSQDINEIKYVFSHPQAIGQCATYLSNKGFEVTETSSTAEAARTVAEKSSQYAAIASETAAETYNLNILEKDINDEKENKTRFILLARQSLSVTENCKTSIFFTVKNEPGSLVKILNIFNKFNINLIYIESRPSKKKMGEYIFYADLEGHISDKNIASALNLAERITNTLKILGSYPKFIS